MKKRILISVLAIICLIGIDQVTKAIAVQNLKSGAVVLIPGIFQLNYVENTGAAFGIMKGSIVIFSIITFIVIGLIIFAYFKFLQKDKFKVLRILAIFIVSGAIGNFIDRIINGYVVDFMQITFINFPVFNVADIYVSWSAVIAFILLIFKYKDSDFKENAN